MCHKYLNQKAYPHLCRKAAQSRRFLLKKVWIFLFSGQNLSIYQHLIKISTFFQMSAF
nr:MAG TPA: hypothetical protein [Caudoviricetes sp.]